MIRGTRAAALAVGGVVVAALLVFAVLLGDDPTDAGAGRVGERAPNFEVTDLSDSTVSRRDLAGKVVVVNFWNTWCPPCVAELPALEEFFAAHQADPDVVLLGIVRDDPEQAVRTFVEGHDLGWTIAFDQHGKAALDFGVRGQPETYVIGPNGRIAALQIGPSSVADLEQMLLAGRAASG